MSDGPPLTAADMEMLRLAKGGITLDSDTAAGRRAQSLCDRGFMKEVMLLGADPSGCDRIAWKLTGLGCQLAYEAS